MEPERLHKKAFDFLQKEFGAWPFLSFDSVEKDLKKIWSKEKWNARHLQIIFFGREFCPARNHNLRKCPICSWAASKKRIKYEMKN